VFSSDIFRTCADGMKNIESIDLLANTLWTSLLFFAKEKWRLCFWFWKTRGMVSDSILKAECGNIRGWKTKVILPRLFWVDESSAGAFAKRKCLASFFPLQEEYDIALGRVVRAKRSGRNGVSGWKDDHGRSA
jgi:hypothetical protein